MNYKGKIEYPFFLNEVANIIGELRWKRNKKTRANNGSYSRQSKEAELSYDVTGLLAELIIQYHFFNNGKEFSSAPLLDNRPQSVADIKLRDMFGNYLLCDVKGMQSGYARINKQSHENKFVDIYIFVKPILINEKSTIRIAEYWTARYNEIDNWELKKNNLSEFYEFKIINEEKPEYNNFTDTE